MSSIFLDGAHLVIAGLTRNHTTYMAFLMSETADQVRSDVVAGIHGFFHW